MSAEETSLDEWQTCEPLDSIDQVMSFLDNPPVWRSLCTQLNPHSPQAIRNMDINEKSNQQENFCHFDLTGPKRHEKKTLSKTLVCHDLANGYHDDSLIGGTSNYKAYNFYNWAGIDVFCYFSHHFITIPPLAWINVGHKHGVKVIGTIITEWKDGEKLWNDILISEKTWREFACALAAIAKCMQFDGWLLNVENKISKPKQLLMFVEYFQSVLHEEMPGSLLIWYDSVTVSGHLQWQNGLNHKNKAFFDVSDGFFTNYSWNEKDVESSAAAAGSRLHDLYIGIDVWGRNFYGGGKFNTVEAVKVAHKYNCSLAIFAPAWTHEGICPEPRPPGPVPLADALPLMDNYLLRDRAFWSSLWPYLNTSLPRALPFQTSFCRGQGLSRRLHGKDASLEPWYNLRHMEYQPNSALGAHGYLLVPENELPFRRDLTTPHKRPKRTTPDLLQTSNAANPEDPEADKEEQNSSNDSEEPTSATKRMNRPPKSNNELLLVVVPEQKPCLEFYMNDAFTGGSCIKINPTDETSNDHRNIRLMHCDFYVEEAIIVCVVTKTLAENRDQYLNVFINVRDSSGRHEVVALCGGGPETPGAGGRREYPVSGDQFRDLQKYILRESPHFYVPVENSFGWETRYFVVSSVAAAVHTVWCRTGRPHGGILLGHLGLCHKKLNSIDPEEISSNRI